MPRRQFVADLEQVKTGILPLGITNVQAGDDDGQIEFNFTAASGPVNVTALVPDLGEYPKSHEYMIFGDDDATRDISSALQSIRGTERKTVFEMLDIVSTTLSRLQTDRDGDSQMQDSAFDDEDDLPEEDESDASDDFDEGFASDPETFGFSQPMTTSASTSNTSTSKQMRTSTRQFRQRLREDLRTTKAAGFRVGHLGQLLEGNNAYVTVSIRISKLGISEEAMQAWQLDPSEYLILIIQYPNGYKTNEEFQAYDSLRLNPNIAIRVVIGKRYKPSLQEAIKAFTVARKSDRNSTSVSDIPKADEYADQVSSIRESFISKPLTGLMTERLVPILRFRSAGMDWQGAEKFYQHQIESATTLANADIVPDDMFRKEVVSDAFPSIMRADHHTDKGRTVFSFPLLAMQFTLRHFVRCTEFCLVCHRKLDTEVEAIKPYVCDNSLCLYQYMSLGLGPSIEHELLAQPYTVDLLTSFCYSSAVARKLKEFPDGLSLTVLPVNPNTYNIADPYMYHYRARPAGDASASGQTVAPATPAQTYEIGFDHQKLELIFFDKSQCQGCPVRSGDWIVINSASSEGFDLHCRVKDVSLFPTITIYDPIQLRQQRDSVAPAAINGHIPQTPAHTTPNSPAPVGPGWSQATFQVYNVDFSNLDTNGKCLSICRLLETLPSVIEMRDHLTKTHSADLKSWIERISPSALSLFRWIIASNRSCIMQVDGDAPENTDSSGPTTLLSKTKERCYGMKDYMQFRFAMGAPDKEQRFITEVRNTTERLSLQYPTIFAWHGSPLHNWHMIIREGLHFKNADHGRAYGDGVYHAKDAGTSSGYSGFGGNRTSCWPNSSLRISSALALNEIVNAPTEFQSSNPYYVVKQLDWIQTRYLFVQVSPKSDNIKVGAEVKPSNAHPQDPTRTPRGCSDAIMIPASAIKSSKTARGIAVSEASPKNPNPFKRLKLFGGASNPVVIDDDEDSTSDATDTEDVDILFDEPEVTEPPPPIPDSQKQLSDRKKAAQSEETDFVPGSLDFSRLPLMPLPEYATSATTKRLMKELQSLAKVQESTPPVELGWYIDVEKVDNAYQWIVELHSFHTFEVKGKKLPLADDMKQQNIKSIVLELRFNKDFPFTPPYVRVVRPQFLTISQGGGGHIVMGGAMCMELLTNTGWSSVSSMESVLMQIRLAIASEPYARLNKRHLHDYGVHEAAEGYMRACATHGWQVPPGFKEMAYGIGKQA